MDDSTKTKAQLLQELSALRAKSLSTAAHGDDMADLRDPDQIDRNYRELLEYKTSLLNNLSDAVITTDLNFTILSLNTAAESLYGWKTEEVRGKPITTVLKTEYTDQTTKDEAARTLQKNGVWRGEVIQRRKDGSPIYVSASISMVKDRNGSVIEVIAVNRDLTAFKKTELDLAASERKYRELIETANSIILRWNIDGIITYVNDFGAHRLGYEQRELVGRPVMALVPDFESTGKNISTLAQDILDHPEEYVSNPNENIRKDGTRIWVAWTNKAITDSQGDVQEILAIGNDITALKQAVDKIQWLAKFPVSNPFPVLRISRDGEVLFANDASKELLKVWRVKKGQTVSAPLRDVVKTVLDSCRHVEQEVTVGKQTVLLCFTYSNVAEYVNIYGFDITARKQAEKALGESQRDLSHAQNVGNIGNWRLDVHKNELLWSDENYRIFGAPKGTPLTYETFLGTVHPDDREYVDKMWKAGLAGDPYDIEHRIVIGDEIRWVREKAVLEFDTTGRLMGGFGITQDITEKKQFEQALRESEERFRMVLENSLDGIHLTDVSTGKFVFVNQAHSVITGFSCGELRSFTTEDILNHVHSDDRERYQQYINRVVGKEGTGETIEYRWKMKNGLFRWFSGKRKAIRDEHGDAIMVVGVTRDIHEEKRLQERINRNEQLLTHMLEQFPGVVSLWDRKQRLVYANRKWEEIFRSDKNQLKGKNLDAIYPKKERGMIRGFFSRVLESGEECEAITTHGTPDGEVIYLRRFIPLHDKNDVVDVVVDIGQEITRFEETRKSLETMRDRLEKTVATQTTELAEAQVNISQTNIALNKLIEGYKNQEHAAQRKIIANLDTMVLPYVKELDRVAQDRETKRLLSVIKQALDEITMTFGNNLGTLGLKLSPAELQVAHLIRNNYETEEIAEMLHIEPNTVFTHRRRIRKKMGLPNTVNLKTYLMSVAE